jgi:hypothetical protein
VVADGPDEAEARTMDVRTFWTMVGVAAGTWFTVRYDREITRWADRAAGFIAGLYRGLLG